jgi:PPOX class probable F420-dependent enzyme
VEIPLPVLERVLAAWPEARLATLDDAGRPALVPIVFAWHGGALWSPVDGKPKRSPHLARIAHVERDPRVCVLIDHYDADWSRLWWVRVEGEASVVRARGSEDDPLLGPVAEALRAKYRGYASTPLFLGVPTLLRIAPSRIAGWCASPAALDPLAPGKLEKWSL